MTVHLAGDSTVASGKPEETPLTGWGGCLHRFIDAPVVNHAVGGATTESFTVEGRWSALLDALSPGDRVLIQFGHNDQKELALAARAGYRDRLRGFVDDVRERGASPVLLTSVERRLFEGDRVRRSHGPYPHAVRDLCRELDVPVIDLTSFTSWLYEWLGPQRSCELFVHAAAGEFAAWPDGIADDTHFRTEGAMAVAGYVGQALAALDRVGEDHEALGRWGIRP